MNTPRLVPPHIDRRLAKLVAMLADSVNRGEVIGLALGVSLRGRRYFVDVGGTFVDDPTFARGVVAALDDKLRAMVQDQADQSETRPDNL